MACWWGRGYWLDGCERATRVVGGLGLERGTGGAGVRGELAGEGAGVAGALAGELAGCALASG